MNYTGLLAALLGVLLIVVVSEVLWRTSAIRGESARKFIHISAGTFIAFWPYFLSWPQIVVLSVGGLLAVLAASRIKAFHAGFDITRRSKGEIFFPISIGIAALIQPAPIVFTAAMLHLSLADGLAAVIGVKYGVIHRYKVRNYVKTLAGTLTFFTVSLMIVCATILISGTTITWPLVPLLIWLPLVATAAENLAPAGTDNIFVPLVVILVLQTVIT